MCCKLKIYNLKFRKRTSPDVPSGIDYGGYAILTEVLRHNAPSSSDRKALDVEDRLAYTQNVVDKLDDTPKEPDKLEHTNLVLNSKTKQVLRS